VAGGAVGNTLASRVLEKGHESDQERDISRIYLNFQTRKLRL